MKKNFEVGDIDNSAPTQMDMELINKLSRRELASGEVYTFNIVLCDNDIDRDNEAFTLNALEALAKGFEGVAGGFNHAMDVNHQHARIYSCQTVTDKTRKNAFGDSYSYLLAKAYIPKTNENLALIEEIDTGIKKEVSISCKAKSVCSICGERMDAFGCSHIRGRYYEGRYCCAIIDEISDCYEWSFVCVPAQPNARVTKSFYKGEKAMDEILKQLKNCQTQISLSAKEANALHKRYAELEALAADGIAYKEKLKGDIIKLCAFTLPLVNAKSVESICEKLDVRELKELKQGLSLKADEHNAPGVQLECGKSVYPSQNNQFKI